MTDFLFFFCWYCSGFYALVRKLLQWLWLFGIAWREPVIAEHYYPRSVDWCSRSKLSAIIHAPFITVCDIVCIQYLTSLGCYSLVTSFLPPLLTTRGYRLLLMPIHKHFPTDILITSVIPHRKRIRGFVRAVLTCFLWTGGKWITAPTYNLTQSRWLLWETWWSEYMCFLSPRVLIILA